MSIFRPTSRSHKRRALLVIAACALSPAVCSAASCEWSQRFANDIVEMANQAREAQNELMARRFVREARPAAIDAAKEAKSCGCEGAIPNFEQAAQHAMYADRAFNLTAIHQYAARVKAEGEKALDALHRCSP